MVVIYLYLYYKRAKKLRNAPLSIKLNIYCKRMKEFSSNEILSTSYRSNVLSNSIPKWQTARSETHADTTSSCEITLISHTHGCSCAALQGAKIIIAIRWKQGSADIQKNQNHHSVQTSHWPSLWSVQTTIERKIQCRSSTHLTSTFLQLFT